MIFSFKPQSSFDSFPSLSVSGSPLERIFCFTYLGLLFHCSMSWSPHLASLRKRAKKMIGFLFRNFYSGSSPSTLLKLYTCLVRPILEYCSVVWDPSSSSASSSLESVQFFALKVAFKSWSSSYIRLSSISLSTPNSLSSSSQGKNSPNFQTQVWPLSLSRFSFAPSLSFLDVS